MTADAAVVLFKALMGVVAFVTDNEGKIGEALSMMEQETGKKISLHVSMTMAYRASKSWLRRDGIASAH